MDSEVQRARSLRNAILARVQKQQREEAAFANFLGSNSPADLTRNMKQYLSEFPSSNLSSDFAVVASEESLWRAADQWNELMKAATADLNHRKVARLNRHYAVRKMFVVACVLHEEDCLQLNFFDLVWRA